MLSIESQADDEREKQLLALLASFDEWLGNDEPLMIEDIIEWRDRLAVLLGQPKVG